MNWKIEYYERENGYCPVMDLIDSRKTKNKIKIFALLELLEQKGPHLPRPYADLLEDGIHELRIKLARDEGGTQMRILYFFYERTNVVLTHGFMKTTDKVPLSEINRAKKYREDYLNQKFNAKGS